MEARNSSSAGPVRPQTPSLLCPASTALVGRLWGPEGKIFLENTILFENKHNIILKAV
jgi:hypothetical protein